MLAVASPVKFSAVSHFARLEYSVADASYYYV